MRFTGAWLIGAILPGLSVGWRIVGRDLMSTSVNPSVLTSRQDVTVHEISGVCTATMEAPSVGTSFLEGSVQFPGTSSDSVFLSLDVLVGSRPVKRSIAIPPSNDCSIGVTINGQSVLNASLALDSNQVLNFNTSSVAGGANYPLEILEYCGVDSLDYINVANLTLYYFAGPGSSSAVSSTIATSVAPPSSVATSSHLPSPVPSSPASTPASAPASTPASAAPSTPGSSSPFESASPTRSSAPAASVSPTNPPTANSFAFFACAGSTTNFPTFRLARTDALMDIEMCTSICSTSAFAGTHDQDCYCGTAITNADDIRILTNECTIPCPGDNTEICGGTILGSLSRLARRQSVPANDILTVFVNSAFVAAAGGNIALIPPLGASVTAAAVSAGLTASTGSQTASTATSTVTSTSVLPSASMSCTTGYCGTGWMFEPCEGAVAGEVVFEAQTCSCEGGWAYYPITCSADDCAGKVVHRPKKCVDSECEGALVFQAESCSECIGGISYTQAANQSSNAANASAEASAGASTETSSGASAEASAEAGAQSQSGAAAAAAAAAAGSSSGSSSASSGSSASSSSSFGVTSSGNQTSMVAVAGSGRQATAIDSLALALLIFMAVF